MVRDLITCEIKSISIRLIEIIGIPKGRYHKDTLKRFGVIVCPIKNTSEKLITKHNREYQSDPYHVVRLTPIIYQSAQKRFFKLVKQANLKQISFE